MNQSNIVLIGMPGSGKSTLGKMLARSMNKTFIDTDALLEQHENMHIQSILNDKGLAHFRQVEEQVLCGLNASNSIISTGGSAVYSDLAMQHLGEIGLRVYLRIQLPTLLARVTNQGSRGLAIPEDYSLQQLYDERVSLYAAAADIVFDNDADINQLDYQALVAELEQRLA